MPGCRASETKHSVRHLLATSSPLQAYIALARVDPDAAWCQLTAALRMGGKHAISGTPADNDDQRMAMQQAPVASWLATSGTPLTFPERDQLEPPLHAATADAASQQQRSRTKFGGCLAVPPGLLECSATKLSAMLTKVEQMPLSWHMI